METRLHVKLELIEMHIHRFSRIAIRIIASTSCTHRIRLYYCSLYLYTPQCYQYESDATIRILLSLSIRRMILRFCRIMKYIRDEDEVGSVVEARHSISMQQPLIVSLTNRDPLDQPVRLVPLSKPPFPPHLSITTRR